MLLSRTRPIALMVFAVAGLTACQFGPGGAKRPGGVALVYEIDNSEGDSTTVRSEGGTMKRPTRGADLLALVVALQQRLDPDRRRGIAVKSLGDDHIEIRILGHDESAVPRVKRLATSVGKLEFRIVANARDHAQLVDAARQQTKDSLGKPQPSVKDAAGNKMIGYWARVAKNEEAVPGRSAFKVDVRHNVIRDALSGELIEVGGLLAQFNEHPNSFEAYLESRGIKEVDVLIFADDHLDVGGKDLGNVKRGVQNLMPTVNFSMRNPDAARRMGLLTGQNLPDGPFARQLGIILDGTLLSAPSIRGTITDSGQWTGDFTEDDVKFFIDVLQSGELPWRLKPESVSESFID